MGAGAALEEHADRRCGMPQGRVGLVGTDARAAACDATLSRSLVSTCEPFERGTMPEDVCGPRLVELQAEQDPTPRP